VGERGYTSKHAVGAHATLSGIGVGEHAHTSRLRGPSGVARLLNIASGRALTLLAFDQKLYPQTHGTLQFVQHILFKDAYSYLS
jgi:hypothetical protein